MAKKVIKPVAVVKPVRKAIVERKIEADELISLQKEGKLVGYDPATGIGLVKDVGNKIAYLEGGASV